MSWHGVFKPLHDEYDYVVDQVDGALPTELTGTLYRIGCGRWEIGGSLLHFIFDGDGMVSQFTLDGRSVRFRNRYVRTRQFAAGQIRYRGVGTQRSGGWPANFMRVPTNVANTNMASHAGELLALWEGGRPYRLNPDTLETLGEHDFDGRLRFAGAFSAHPKWDPGTGEMFNFGLEMVPKPRIRCYKVDTVGRLRHLTTLALPHTPWNHDFALTERHLVFALDPIIPNMRKVALGTTSIVEALEYAPAQGTRFVLVPRDGGKPRIVEYAGLVHFHVTNAYEDGTDTVVDLVNYDSWARLRDKLVNFRDCTGAPASRLMRYRISATGTVTEQQLTPGLGEYPQYDWRLATRRHRYTYLAGRTTPSTGYDRIMKIDHATGQAASHDLGAGTYVTEQIFVPREPDAAEDDGWLLAVNYLAAEHRSQLLVLDARSLDALAVAQLPHHVPANFHGTFTRRVAVPGAPIPHPDRLPTR